MIPAPFTSIQVYNQGNVLASSQEWKCNSDWFSRMNDLTNGEKPAVPPGPIVSLVYRVKRDNRDKLFRFLKRAIPVYERPGGIQVALYESMEDPDFLFELISYATDSDFSQDQERVDTDPEMKELLSEWHELIDGTVNVSLMKRVTLACED